MEELCQPTMLGQGGLIAPMTMQATDFGLKNHMIQQVQQSYQYHGLPGDDANKHIDKFLTVTQKMKQNGVPHDVLRLCLFSYSLTHHAIAWFDRLSKNSIHSLEEMVTKFLSKYFPPSMGESSRSITSSSPEIAALTQQIAKMNKNFLRMSQSNQQVNVVNPSYENCGGPHHYFECQAASSFTQGDAYAATGNELEGCLALADLGASINLMPLYIWKKLMLPELIPTCMSLELANRSIAYLVGIAEDVFVQVGKFMLLVDFVFVDYDVNSRVPLILGRPFLRTARALVDVHGEELTLRVGDKK
ncbi:reverse transcriptase domain-containing protein, partial [Tanacetum coccineum]